MSKTQLKVLWVGIGIFVLMGLFPPHKMLGATGIHSISVGYHFIVSKDQVREIDPVRLCVQWAIVAVITGGLLYTLKDRKKD